MRTLCVISTLLLSLVACSSVEQGSPERTALGKADAIGSCDPATGSIMCTADCSGKVCMPE